MPSVRVPPVLRQHTGGATELSVEGDKVGAVLESLVSQHPDTREQIFSEEGELNRFVNIYLNDEDVRVLDGLDTAVGADDTIMILPAMAGGSCGS